RSRELDKPPCLEQHADEALLEGLLTPGAERYEALLELLGRGASVESVHERTKIDPWFLRELRALALAPEGPFAGERSFRAGDTWRAELPAPVPCYSSGVKRGPTGGRSAHEGRRERSGAGEREGGAGNRVGAA